MLPSSDLCLYALILIGYPLLTIFFYIDDVRWVGRARVLARVQDRVRPLIANCVVTTIVLAIIAYQKQWVRDDLTLRLVNNGMSLMLLSLSYNILALYGSWVILIYTEYFERYESMLFHHM
jgi:hypothetical protein